MPYRARGYKLLVKRGGASCKMREIMSKQLSKLVPAMYCTWYVLVLVEKSWKKEQTVKKSKFKNTVKKKGKSTKYEVPSD